MSPKDVYSPIPIFFPVESVRHKTKQSTNTKRNTRNQPLQTHIITSTTAADWGIWCRCGIWLSAKYPLGRKKSLLNPLSPWIFSSLLPKESRFPAFTHSFRRSRGRSPSLRAPESHFRRKSILHSFRRSRVFRHFPTPSEGVGALGDAHHRYRYPRAILTNLLRGALAFTTDWKSAVCENCCTLDLSQKRANVQHAL